MKLRTRVESWPIAGVFRISRREARETDVIVVELEADGATGRGEGGPNVRYGESGESCLAQIEEARAAIEDGADRLALQNLMPPGAARNAVDCAFWDLEAKRSGTPAFELAGLPALEPITTAYTLSIDTPELMLAAAEAASQRPLLKVKLAGDEHDVTRLRAVRAAAPRSGIIVDPNESWSIERLQALMPVLASLQIDVIEQPLAAAEDSSLEGAVTPIPICADESCATAADLVGIAGKYQMVNIKLDKAGGLTEALKVAEVARDLGLQVMVGCMLGTSLAMAPAMLVAQYASFVDLDGPLLLERDREDGIIYDGSLMQPPAPSFWG